MHNYILYDITYIYMPLCVCVLLSWKIRSWRMRWHQKETIERLWLSVSLWWLNWVFKRVMQQNIKKHVGDGCELHRLAIAAASMERRWKKMKEANCNPSKPCAKSKDKHIHDVWIHWDVVGFQPDHALGTICRAKLKRASKRLRYWNSQRCSCQLRGWRWRS